jgi:hypothetical protein
LALALFLEVSLASFLAGLITIKPYTDAEQRRK